MASTRHEACLIDVYQTVLTVDFDRVTESAARLAGLTAVAFRTAFMAVETAVTVGELTMTQAAEQILRSAGIEPRPALVREVVEADRRLLRDSARVYDDTIAFLEMLAQRGVRTAFVSNCAENTRPLLAQLGLDALVDDLVLSCEVGHAKPSAEIYAHALDALGVAPESALLVDDQPAYCRGAEAIGVTTAQIVRGETGSESLEPDRIVVRSLIELERYF